MLHVSKLILKLLCNRGWLNYCPTHLFSSLHLSTFALVQNVFMERRDQCYYHILLWIFSHPGQKKHKATGLLFCSWRGEAIRFKKYDSRLASLLLGSIRIPPPHWRWSGIKCNMNIQMVVTLKNTRYVLNL